MESGCGFQQPLTISLWVRGSKLNHLIKANQEGKLLEHQEVHGQHCETPRRLRASPAVGTLMGSLTLTAAVRWPGGGGSARRWRGRQRGREPEDSPPARPLRLLFLAAGTVTARGRARLRAEVEAPRLPPAGRSFDSEVKRLWSGWELLSRVPAAPLPPDPHAPPSGWGFPGGPAIPPAGSSTGTQIGLFPSGHGQRVPRRSGGVNGARPLGRSHPPRTTGWGPTGKRGHGRYNYGQDLEMRSSWIRMGPKSPDSVLIRERKPTQTQRHRERPREAKGRGWRDSARSQELLEPPGAQSGQRHSPLELLEVSKARQTPWFDFCHQDWDGIHFQFLFIYF